MFTKSQLQMLKDKGHIADFSLTDKREQTFKDANTKPRNGLPKIPNGAKNRSEEKGWIHSNILAICNRQALELKTEFHFHPSRDWRFDFAIETKDKKIAIEYEGIISEKSRHTTVTGYSGDVEKYNAGAVLGWYILRYTALNYKNATRDLREILNIKASW